MKPAASALNALTALKAPMAVAALVASLGTAFTTPVQAQTFTLDFEGATSFSSVADFYNGGTDGAGASGINHGASFSGSALALSNDGLGGGVDGAYFSNAPTAGTVMFAADEAALLNVSQGLTGSLSFYYSAAAAVADVITVYSGLNGTGSVLATYSLAANAQANGCSDSSFCYWQQVAVSFLGTAQSISFGGSGAVAYDNITVTAVPEPETYALMALGLAALAVVRRRQRRG